MDQNFFPFFLSYTTFPPWIWEPLIPYIIEKKFYKIHNIYTIVTCIKRCFTSFRLPYRLSVGSLYEISSPPPRVHSWEAFILYYSSMSSIHTKSINARGEILLRSITGNEIAERELLTKKQVSMIVSLQDWLIHEENGRYKVPWKKKHGWYLVIEKIRRKFFLP